MEGYLAAAALLPAGLRRAAMALPEEDMGRCEELRLRRGREMTALLAGREYGLGGVIGENDLRAVTEAATSSSLHAAGEQLRRGFLAGPHGVRVGVCGTAVTDEHGVTAIREISSLAIRVPRAMPGCADGVWGELTAGGFRSALISSPPGVGKTTLLRELIRRLSVEGYRVAVADERGELAGAWNGESAFDVGPRTDVLTGAPKALAAGMLLRAMNPQVLAVDEAADEGEAGALLAAAGAGVQVLATVHGGRGMKESALCRALLAAGVFHKRIWVELRGGRRVYTVERVPCA